MQTFNKMKFFNPSPRQLLATVVNCRSLLWPGSVYARRRLCHSSFYERSTSFSSRFTPDSCCRATSSSLLSHQPVSCSTLQPQTRSHSQLSHRHRPSIKWTCLLIVILVLNAELVYACGPGRSNGRRHAPRTKLIPLVFKQHVPNVSENTLGASGLNEGRITRDHKRFKELVPNYNQDIIFKDDEGTGADRLMTQRLKEKLNMLSILVMNQWPGIKLRVIEGWDEDSKHAMNSLHYEGRAVDITTSDRDRSKYGMLARLAVDAGFDWVYYESRVHIHCSVKSEKSEAGRNGGCFDEKSLVYGRNGSLRIDQLQIGDEILTIDSNGKSVFSKVLMFLDRDPDTERLYYEFKTESGSTITTTPSHLLFISESNSTDSSISRAEFARDIQVGQYLYSTHGELSAVGARAMLERIVSIETRLGRGAYAPLTTTGNLIVNNITASCYAVFRSQSFAHLSFAPIRIAYQFVDLGNRLSKFLQLGFSSYQESSNLTRSTRKSDSYIGIHWYASLLYSTFKYFIPPSIIYH